MTFDAGTWWLAVLLLGFVTAGLVYLLKRSLRRVSTIQRTQDLLDYLRSGPDTLSFFDEALFSELVEKIIVTDNETLRFRLINGLELTESIERTKR